MDIEKEAVVLFCEALKIVGDDFAVCGFSGTGHLGVDYFRIKDFDEEPDYIKKRIGSITPQRNTRTGAAVRHAAFCLNKTDAKTKLLIILSDGFPNDSDYKKEYAFTDTAKSSFSCAFKRNLHSFRYRQCKRKSFI